jgi:hypothetical protein
VLPDLSRAYQLLDQAQDRCGPGARRRHTAVHQAYSKAKAEIDRLRREPEQTQVLDLRWAIFGIYMIAIGIALSYWA